MLQYFRFHTATGVHTRNPKCSLTRPLLWWTGFFVSSIVLLILVSQFFIIISGIYLRKAMLRRGLEGVYFFTVGGVCRCL